MSTRPAPFGSLRQLARPRDRERGGLSRLLGALARPPRIVAYDPARGGLIIAEGDGRVQTLGTMRRSKQGKQRAAEAVVLHFPAGAVLCKRLRLPAAAAANLRTVLALEMDRETPFSLDTVWFTYRIAGRERGGLAVDLLVVPKRLFAECQERLEALGFAAGWISTDTQSGRLRFAVAPDTSRRALIPSAGLLAAGLALAILLTGLDAWQAQRNRAALDAAHAQADRALALQRRLNERGAEPAGRPQLVALLDALTKAIPDGTWLDRLSFDGSSIDISGFAPDAASLLLRLGRSPSFREVHFLGPTVRDAASGREHFQIALSPAEVSP